MVWQPILNLYSYNWEETLDRCEEFWVTVLAKWRLCVYGPVHGLYNHLANYSKRSTPYHYWDPTTVVKMLSSVFQSMYILFHKIKIWNSSIFHIEFVGLLEMTRVHDFLVEPKRTDKMNLKEYTVEWNMTLFHAISRNHRFIVTANCDAVISHEHHYKGRCWITILAQANLVLLHLHLHQYRTGQGAAAPMRHYVPVVSLRCKVQGCRIKLSVVVGWDKIVHFCAGKNSPVLCITK